MGPANSLRATERHTTSPGNMRCSPGSPRRVRAFRAIERRLSGTLFLRSLGSPAVATLHRRPIRPARAQRPRSPTGTAAPTEADPLFGPPTRKAEKPCRAMRPRRVSRRRSTLASSPMVPGTRPRLVCLPRPKTLDFRYLASVMLSPVPISWQCQSSGSECGRRLFCCSSLSSFTVHGSFDDRDAGVLSCCLQRWLSWASSHH